MTLKRSPCPKHTDADAIDDMCSVCWDDWTRHTGNLEARVKELEGPATPDAIFAAEKMFSVIVGHFRRCAAAGKPVTAENVAAVERAFEESGKAHRAFIRELAEQLAAALAKLARLDKAFRHVPQQIADLGDVEGGFVDENALLRAAINCAGFAVENFEYDEAVLAKEIDE